MQGWNSVRCAAIDQLVATAIDQSSSICCFALDFHSVKVVQVCTERGRERKKVGKSHYHGCKLIAYDYKYLHISIADFTAATD